MNSMNRKNSVWTLIDEEVCMRKNVMVARYVKKLAPYTDVEHYVLNPMYEGKKVLTKEYITSKCLSYVEKDGFKI